MRIVTEIKSIKENCSTCLYGQNSIGWDGRPSRFAGCGNANRKHDWMLYAMDIKRWCPSYYLDHTRFIDRRL